MTIKKKLIILLPLFICLIFAANFALAEDDDDDDDYVPVIIQPTVTAPAPIITETILTNKEVPVNTLTDSDADGIIDSLDKYPDQDDFSFNVLDNNSNGIIDELEYLLSL